MHMQSPVVIASFSFVMTYFCLKCIVLVLHDKFWFIYLFQFVKPHFGFV